MFFLKMAAMFFSLKTAEYEKKCLYILAIILYSKTENIN